MTLFIRGENISLDDKTKDYIRKKMLPLEKLAKEVYNNKVSLFIEVERESFRKRKGALLKIVSKLKFPGNMIIGEVSSQDVREGIGELKEIMQREISKHKEKLEAKKERGEKAFKEKLKGI